MIIPAIALSGEDGRDVYEVIAVLAELHIGMTIYHISYPCNAIMLAKYRNTIR